MLSILKMITTRLKNQLLVEDGRRKTTLKKYNLIFFNVIQGNKY